MVTCNGCKQQVNESKCSHFGCIIICELCLARLTLLTGVKLDFNHSERTWAEAADATIMELGDPRTDENSP